MNKPRVRKVNGEWQCHFRGCVGFGSTIEGAYNGCMVWVKSEEMWSKPKGYFVMVESDEPTLSESLNHYVKEGNHMIKNLLLMVRKAFTKFNETFMSIGDHLNDHCRQIEWLRRGDISHDYSKSYPTSKRKGKHRK